MSLEKRMTDKNENMDICLKARNITKIYPGTKALDNVDFNVYRGKVNVLIGENGAGKSTLMKIIAGVEQQTTGDIYLDDKKIFIQNTRDAENYGIGIIHQELNLFHNLTIAQNIFMGKEKTKYGKCLLDKEIHIKKSKELLERLEHSFDPEKKVSDLRVGEQQIVEVAKTMVQQDLKILIMDEPTSSLSASEVEVLFRLISDLKNKGVSIVYISHRLEEIMQIGDYVTILRDGRLVADAETKDIDIPWIVKKMVGHETSGRITRKEKPHNEELLKVESICLPREGGGYAVDHVSFSLKKGEILGLYGLMGAGRTELIECLMGLHTQKSTGKLYLKDKEMEAKSIWHQIRNGFGHIPEDRQREGLVQTLAISNNLTLASLDKFTRLFHIDSKKENEGITEMIKKLYIKVADRKLSIMSLSGGNQQKVVIGKWLLTRPNVLFMDEPTRGIDVGAKDDVFKIMSELADQGLGIVFVGSDLKEILGISDRVIVMSNGKVTGEFLGNDITEQNLVDASYVGHNLTVAN